ncbi:hypothetical protein F8M41_019827 [Gigaspora margarita]|uniref:Uncharacterized protein n=1 Tax=Gigaspora margarita TaxID=4874 RepID=A0A8H4AJH0_GIGMA|nr:hypothetical protein F8M41_019827 [Gigaspora margarita]
MENVSETPIERQRRLKRESAARMRDNQTKDQKKMRKRQCRESMAQKSTCATIALKELYSECSFNVAVYSSLPYL